MQIYTFYPFVVSSLSADPTARQHHADLWFEHDHCHSNHTKLSLWLVVRKQIPYRYDDAENLVRNESAAENTPCKHFRMLNIFTSIQNQDQRFDLMIIKIIYDTNKWVLRVPILCHSAGVYTEFSTLSVTENRFEKLAFFLLISIIVKFQITLLQCIRVHYQILL